GPDHASASGVDPRPGAERAPRLARHLATLGERLHQGQLDLEPAREARLLGPEPAHLRAGVAVNHFWGPVRCSRAPRAALLRWPQTPSPGSAQPRPGSLRRPPPRSRAPPAPPRPC